MLPFVIAGLALGSIYALSGIGLVLLYRASGTLNFAQGAYGALAVLIGWELNQVYLVALLPALALEGFGERGVDDAPIVADELHTRRMPFSDVDKRDHRIGASSF